MKRRTRFVSLLLAASMALSLFPVSAFADNTGGGVGSTTQQAADDSTVNIAGKTGPLTIKANTDGTYTITEGDPENGGSTKTVTADSITVTGTATTGTGGQTGLALSIDGTAAAANVTLDRVEIDNSARKRQGDGYLSGVPGMAVTGTVNLTLGTEKSVLKGGYDCAGLQKNDDGQLTIYGPGELEAIGGTEGAGIGGGDDGNGSNITINSGTVIATGGARGAGIGGGRSGNGSNIIIDGGTVTATGGDYAGAGIGGGDCGNGSYITINNGTVIASTNDYDNDGAGIGGGAFGEGSHITIKGGIVTATSTQRGAAIGGGMRGKGTDISISAGSVTIQGKVGIGGGGPSSSWYECGEGSRINLTGGSVNISNCSVGIGGMYCTSACEDIEISNCDLSIARAEVGIGAYYPYVPSKNISIKENAAVTISGGSSCYIGDYGSSDYANPTDGQDLSREATAGLTTGHVYGYKSGQNPEDASVYPDLVLPQYGVKVNDLDVDFYNKANVLNILKKKPTSSAAAPVVAYDPAAKKLTGNGSFENATTIAVTDGYTQTNGDLTNKLQVELNNTNTDASGAYAMGKLTVTGAKDVTVNNNANYKVTLNDVDITPLDQPLSYTKDTAGGTLVVEKAYIISVTGGKAYNIEGKPIAYAEPGDAVIIQADAPAAPADPAAADAPDAIFANWETDNDLTINETTGSKVNGSAKRVLVFTMPAASVKINAVNQYKLTVTGGKAYDAADTADEPAALRYAKADTEIRLVADADNADKGILFASWKTDSLANLSIARVNGCQDRETTFTMPAEAVTVSVSSKNTSVTPRAYRVQVQLPADVAFAEDAAPVTVSVPDPTGTDEDPKPDRTSNTALGAEPEQLVTLKFDATTLPEGYTFGQWVVTQLLPEQTTVAVEKGTSDLEATFSMPASPVTVTFTVNAPEPEPEPSGDGGAGAVVAGALIGGTAYLLGTRAWLEGTYGYVPANRMELALGLWKRADCPAPESTELYADIEQNDADAQAAARWCVEQGLLKDYRKQNDDGTETVTFKPGRYVARPYALTRWYKLEKLLSEQ